MDAIEAERVLGEAILRAKQEGLEIVTGTLGSRSLGRCCPLGALILDHDPVPSRLDQAASILGWTTHQVSAFLKGFDHQRASEPHQDINRLGLRLRAEYLPPGREVV